MALDPIQQTSADVLAVRIILGQLIVRIAAGTEDPNAVLQVMLEGSLMTADMAKLRNLPDELEEEMRQHLRESFIRFFGSIQMMPTETRQ